MIGIMFNLLEEIVSSDYGQDAWQELLEAAAVKGNFTALGDYPDEALDRLLAAAPTTLHLTQDEVLRWFQRAVMGLFTTKQELALLKTVAVAANRATRPEEALQVAVDRVCAYTGWPLGHALLTDRSTGAARSTGIWHPVNPSAFEAFRSVSEELSFPPGVGLPGRVLASRAPAWIDPPTPSVALPRKPLADAAGLQSAFAFPITIGDEVAGVLEFFTKQARTPDRSLLALMTHIGAQLGQVIERDRAEEQLRLAREAAEETTRGKSAFLATMSHEIRTPLNAVIGMTDLLQNTELTGEQRSFVSTIATSGEALLSIINDVLDFSKIEAGRLELENQAFMVQDCVESALDLVSVQAADKSLEVACLLDSDVPQAVFGDSTRLRQILCNLLSNAVKFTDAGHVVVSVGRVADPPSRHQLRFSVSDTGIGIPPDRMDRLFRDFSQVDPSTTRRYGGTGLGLVVSKRLAELMGGTMWAESEVGRGSTFNFTILAEPTSSLPPRYTRATNAPLAGRRVLIVDDNAVNREVVRRQTSAWEMLPRETASPFEALEWVRRGDPFDVAILDLAMPDMDGVTLAEKIRSQAGGQGMQLLLVSLGPLADERAAELFGAVLLKPVKASPLHDALLSVLQTSAPWPEPDRRAEAGTSPAQHSLRILLTEDNPVNQQVALLMLDKLGYRADVAGNGVEALAALERGSYDVVLMDVEMPEMDGLEASRQIHQRWPHDGRPRIIGMTANAMEGDREACLVAGMDDYLAKPIRREGLAAALACAVPPPVPPIADALDGGPAVVDPAALEELRQSMGDDAVVAELIDVFFADAPALLQGLHSRDVDQLRRAAHTLKSNGRTFGARSLAELCARLEADARNGDLGTAEELVPLIEAEYGRVHEALTAFGGRA
ncbi:response regulator [Streptomyces erythrochromogenes]|uniref:response regulator n=1 Tax=Streptomyces erythrochromogenes TaxID=285574 RepID=UPI00344583B1